MTETSESRATEGDAEESDTGDAIVANALGNVTLAASYDSDDDEEDDVDDSNKDASEDADGEAAAGQSSNQEGKRQRNLKDGERLYIFMSLALLYDSETGKFPKGAVENVTKSWDRHISTIYRIWNRGIENFNGKGKVDVNARMYLTGRPRSIDPKTFAMAVDELPRHQKGSMRSVAAALEVSLGTVYRMKKEGAIIRVAEQNNPPLSPPMRRARLEFAASRISLRDPSRFSKMFHIIVCDETMVRLHALKSYIYCDADNPKHHRSIKVSFIPNIMYFSAVGRPIVDDETGELVSDGKFGMFPFAEVKVAQRNSHNRPAGTPEFHSFDVSTEEMLDMMINNLLPSIVEKVSKWPDKYKQHTFIIQLDNASVHVKASKDERWHDAVAKCGLDIQIQFQPSNSPDTNANDLFFYASFKLGQLKHQCKNVTELVYSVEETWQEYPYQKLEDGFMTQQAVLLEIFEHDGGNEFKKPHLNKEARRKNGTLPFSLPLSERALHWVKEFEKEKQEQRERDYAAAVERAATGRVTRSVRGTLSQQGGTSDNGHAPPRRAAKTKQAAPLQPSRAASKNATSNDVVSSDQDNNSATAQRTRSATKKTTKRKSSKKDGGKETTKRAKTVSKIVSDSRIVSRQDLTKLLHQHRAKSSANVPSVGQRTVALAPPTAALIAAPAAQAAPTSSVRAVGKKRTGAPWTIPVVQRSVAAERPRCRVELRLQRSADKILTPLTAAEEDIIQNVRQSRDGYRVPNRFPGGMYPEIHFTQNDFFVLTQAATETDNAEDAWANNYHTDAYLGLINDSMETERAANPDLLPSYCFPTDLHTFWGSHVPYRYEYMFQHVPGTIQVSVSKAIAKVLSTLSAARVWLHVPWPIQGGDVFKLDKAFFMIRIMSHWTFVVAYMQHKRLEHFDSYGVARDTPATDIFKILSAWHKKKNGTKLKESEWTFNTRVFKPKQQTDDMGCGFFSLLGIELITLQDSSSSEDPIVRPVTQRHIDGCRDRMTLAIVTEKTIIR